MARTTKPLTDAEVRKAKPSEKMTKLFDGNGLVLIIKPNGRKIWRVNYSMNKKQKSFTIGDYPTVTLTSARIKASEVKQLAKEGIDPVADRKERQEKPRTKNAVTFKEIMEEFLNLMVHEWSASHYKKQRSRAEIYLYPHLQDVYLKEITKQDLIQLIKDIPTVVTKSSKQTNKLDTAHRVHLLLGQLFDYAIHHEIIVDNVPRRIAFNKVHPTIEQTPIPAIVDMELVREMYQMFDNYTGHFTTKIALKFLALSALRPGNIRNMKWEYVDFHNDVVNFPKEAMKAKKPFSVPLTKTLVYLIDQMKPLTRYKSEYVFCSPVAPSSSLSENTLNQAHKRLEIVGHTSHGWRSAFSTICHTRYKQHGFSSDVIEAQLAHTVGSKVKQAYLRTDYIVERQQLLEWWEQQLNAPVLTVG